MSSAVLLAVAASLFLLTGCYRQASDATAPGSAQSRYTGSAPWTIDDVARYARCSLRHVTTLREHGLPYRKLGHLVRFSPEAVKRWFEGP